MEFESSSRRMRAAEKLLRKQRLSALFRLRSIEADSKYLGLLWESMLQPLPIVPNLRNGLWYCESYFKQAEKENPPVAYFKSTDGHEGQVNFHLSRANMHIALLASNSTGVKNDSAEKNNKKCGNNFTSQENSACLPECCRGGVVLVDSTRFGKVFPDSFTRTVPVWCAIINSAVSLYRSQQGENKNEWWKANETICFPPWVRKEKEAEDLREFVKEKASQLLFPGSLIGEIASKLKNPLRPVWISPESFNGHGGLEQTSCHIDFRNGHRDPVAAERLSRMTGSETLTENPNSNPNYKPNSNPDGLWTPIVCVSVSVAGITDTTNRMHHSWSYVQGAGDDEENWAQGLTPKLFWENKEMLLGLSKPEEYEEVIREIICTDAIAKAKLWEDGKTDGKLYDSFFISKHSCIGYYSDHTSDLQSIQPYKSSLLIDISPKKVSAESKLIEAKKMKITCGNTKTYRKFWLDCGFREVLMFFSKHSESDGDICMVQCQDKHILIILVSLISLQFHNARVGDEKHFDHVLHDMTVLKRQKVSKEDIRQRVLFIQAQFAGSVSPPRWMIKLLITFFTCHNAET